jgi:hypothetical protein
MWERVSWGLDVRLDVDVLRVRRTGARELPIEIEVNASDRLYPYDEGPTRRLLHFDKLIVACPLAREVLSEFFYEDEVGEQGLERRSTLSADEEALLSKIAPHTYVQNTLHAVTVDPVTHEERPFRLFAPVVPVFPFDRRTFGKPWVVVQVWGKQSRLLQFYTRIDPSGERAQETQHAIETASRELLRLFGGTEAGSTHGNERLARWTTYDRWPYFSHVQPEDMRAGFFADLDALQGQHHTYYTGGAATFEMVEAIVRHAKHTAERVHRDLRAEAFPKPRRVPFRPMRAPYAEAERLVPD